MTNRFDSDGVKYYKEGEGIVIEVKEISKAKEILTKYADSIDDFEVVKGRMDNVFLNVTGKQLKEASK